jgi:hypothetical protein
MKIPYFKIMAPWKMDPVTQGHLPAVRANTAAEVKFEATMFDGAAESAPRRRAPLPFCCVESLEDGPRLHLSLIVVEVTREMSMSVFLYYFGSLACPATACCKFAMQ